jgi:hypothetical protein
MTTRAASWFKRLCETVKNPDLRRTFRERVPAAKLVGWADAIERAREEAKENLGENQTKISLSLDCRSEHPSAKGTTDQHS